MEDDQNIIKSCYKKIKLIAVNGNRNIWKSIDIYTGELCRLTEQQDNQKGRNILNQGKIIQITQGYIGIPKLYWCGRCTNKHLYLITENLGPTLAQLAFDLKYNLSLQSVCILGIELIKIIESYHSKHYVYRQISPDSISIGVGKKYNQIYLSDCYESRLYLNRTGLHVDLTQQKLTRFNYFLSRDRSQGYQVGRKDDLESIILMLIFFLKKQLPWYKPFKQNGQPLPMRATFTLKNDVQFKQVLTACKNTINSLTIYELCSGLPVQFIKLMEEVRSYKFQEQPDYLFFIRKIKMIMLKNGFIDSSLYDWNRRNKGNKQNIVKRLKINTNLVLRSTEIKLKNEEKILKEYYTPYEKDIILQ